MRIGPILSATAASARRDRAVIAAVVVTVAICLSLLGAGLLLRAQVRAIDAFVLDRVEVVIELRDDATVAQRRSTEAALRADPLVAEVTFESKQAVFERFRRDFRQSPEVVAGVTADDLPAALRVALTDPELADDIVVGFTDRAGVEAVRDQRALLAPLYRFLDGLQTAAFVLAALPAVASAILLHTMIVIAARGRRRETSIMRLVGATNRAIRAPFVLSSALSGLVGGLLAAAALAGLKVFLVDGRLARRAPFPLLGWDAVWETSGTVLCVGTCAAAAMAGFALRRQLRV